MADKGCAGEVYGERGEGIIRKIKRPEDENMGYMSEEKVIQFLRTLGERIRSVGEEYAIEGDLDDIVVRYASKTLGIMDVADGYDDPEKWEEADCSLAEMKDDPYLDVYIICEGEWYEEIYQHVERGTGGFGEALYEAFNSSAEDYDMTMDFCGGALAFQSSESWDKQNEDEQIEREKADKIIRTWTEKRDGNV